jgi:hypothetical protein
LSEHDSLEIAVEFGPGVTSLYQVIEWWAYEVLTYREIALGENGHNPRNRWVDDFVGTLHIRQAIGDALRLPDGSQRPHPASLRAVDDLHIASTEPDERGFLKLREPYYLDYTKDPTSWWWGRFPAAGAIYEEALEMVGEKPASAD